MDILKKPLGYIANLGVTGDLSENKTKRVRITNILSLSTFLLSAPYYILFDKLGADFQKYLVIWVLIYTTLLLVINRFGFIDLSRFIAPNMNALVIFTYSTSLGPDTRFFLFYFPALSGSFLYYERKEKHFFLFQFIFTSILIVLDLFVKITPFPPVNLSQGDAVFSSYFLMVFAIILFIVCLFTLDSETKLFEKRLNHNNQLLAESERKFRNLITNIPDIVWTIDRNGRYKYISPNVQNILGFSASEIIASPEILSTRIHPADKPAVSEAIDQMFSNNIPFDIEYRLQKKNEDWIWVYARSTNSYIENEIPYADGILFDITRRKKTEQRITALADLRQKLLDADSLELQLKAISDEIVRIFDAAFARIWVLRPGDRCRGECLYRDGSEIQYPHCQATPRCLHLIASSGTYTNLNGQYSRIPIGGKKIGKLLEEDQDHFIINDIAADPDIQDRNWVKSLGLKSIAGFTLKSPEGTAIGALASFSPHPIEIEDIGLLSGMASSTSQIIHMGLARESLIIAKQEAEEANAAKSDFLARISHEIRTPMNAVIGLSHLALQTELNRQQRDYLRKIESSSKALLGIINDILDFSKIEAGKFQIEKTNFDLPKVIENLSHIFSYKAAEKKLTLQFELDPELPNWINGDPLRLGQVLTNLLSNGIKFTESGFVHLSVNRVHQDTRQVQVRFSVKDSGIGLKESDMARLFESFFQVDGSITRKIGGTGLGLAISKQLVELMGGELKVQSRIGEGSEFFFILTFGYEDQLIESKPFPRPKAGFYDKKALIIEDTPINQQVISELLSQVGMDFDIVDNGIKGIQQVRSNPYDLVLMDIQMPEMDGFTTTRQIRAAGFKALPIIAMTAHVQDTDREKCLEAGMNDFLSKPIDPDVLYRKIGQFIDVKETAGAAASTPSNDREAVLPEIDGLDSHTGLMRLRGNIKLYLKLLTEYPKTYRHAIDQIMSMINDNQIKGAAHFVHSIRGASSTIGLNQMAQAFDAVESALQVGEIEKARKLLNTQEQSFIQLVTRLAKHFPDNSARENGVQCAVEKTISPSNGNVETISLQELVTRVHKLIDLCRNRDAESLNLAKTLQEHLSDSPYASAFNAIIEQVEDIEFETAIRLSEELLNQIIS